MGKERKQFAIHVIRDSPPSIYGLPGDGRKGKQLRQDRRNLLLQLVTYGNPDGTSVRPTYPTLMEKLEWSRDKLSKRLKELRGLDFLETTGRLHEKGPALRRIKLEVIEARVRDWGKSPRLNGDQESEIDGPRVRDTQGKSLTYADQESEIPPDDTSPLHLPTTPPLPPGSRGRGEYQTPETIVDTDTAVKELVKLLADKGLPCEFWKGERATLIRKITDHGLDLVTKALKCYISGARMLNSKTLNPWGKFVDSNFDDVWLPAAKEVRERKELTPEEMDRITANAIKMHMEQWKMPEPEPEPDLEQLFGEPKTSWNGDCE